MTENAIIKMAAKIRNKVGTSRTFTLPEIATLMDVPDHFPDFSPTKTLTIDGTPLPVQSDKLPVYGGHTISYTFSYTLNHADLLQKLIGSSAHLYLDIPVIKYQDTNLAQHPAAQTIHVLKKDGSNLINPVSIKDNDILYKYTDLQLNKPLSNELFSYLTNNQPIEVRYDNIEKQNHLSLYTDISLYLLLLYK